MILHQFSFPLPYVFRVTIFSPYGLFPNEAQRLALPARAFIFSPKLPDVVLIQYVLTVESFCHQNYFYRP